MPLVQSSVYSEMKLNSFSDLKKKTPQTNQQVHTTRDAKEVL